ncbi:MAG: L,D-transpeptidase [Muricoprocola sp.]
MAERARRRRQIEEEKKSSSSKRTFRKVLIAIEIVVVCLLVAVGGYCAYDRIMDSKTMGCKISVFGENVSWMTAEDAADKIIEKFQKCVVTLQENGTEEMKVTLKDAGYSLNREALIAELQNLRSKLDPCKVLFEKEKHFTVKYQVTSDVTVASQVFDPANFKDTEGRIKSEDAYIVFDEEADKYKAVDSVLGTVIDKEKLLDTVQEKLSEAFPKNPLVSEVTIDLDKSIYQEAAVTENSKKLKKQLKNLNNTLEGYLNATVTYEFGDVEEVIDSEMIRSWLDIEDDSVTLMEEPIEDYVYNLGLNYNTQYVPRYFETSTGDVQEISNNEYGYWIDETAEYEQLLADLQGGEPVSREPIYTSRGMQRNGNDDLCGSYVEVSLEQQHLWLYVDGELITETDVVTGRPQGLNKKTGEMEDWSTYKGSYPIAYKEHPSVLSSDIYGYEVEVQYWMPFVYGQGLHDMSRDAYGGEIYKTNGSHGCINLPPEQAAIIYEYVDANFPIIIY